MLRSKAEVSSCLQCVSSKEEPLPACEQVADEVNDCDQWQWNMIGIDLLIMKFYADDYIDDGSVEIEMISLMGTREAPTKRLPVRKEEKMGVKCRSFK